MNKYGVSVITVLLMTLFCVISRLHAQTLPSAPDRMNPIILGNKRITLITPTLFRLEYAEEQAFLDSTTMLARCRDTIMQSGFTVKPLQGGKQYEISTNKVRILIDNDNLPFGQIN
ncbi:MAG: hypothetical protein PUC90_01610, partial [Prevotella sp.]|nr:hypothetical protein [Prevotella sp.]